MLFSASREFHQVSFDEAVYLSVHHTVHVAGLEIGAVVFHAAVVEDVATNLATPLACSAMRCWSSLS